MKAKGQTVTFELGGEVKQSEGVPSLPEYKVGDEVEITYYGSKYQPHWTQRVRVTAVDWAPGGFTFDGVPIGKPKVYNYYRYGLYRVFQWWARLTSALRRKDGEV